MCKNKEFGVSWLGKVTLKLLGNKQTRQEIVAHDCKFGRKKTPKNCVNAHSI